MDKDGGMSLDEFANVIGELHQAKQDAVATVMSRIQQEAREQPLSQDTPMTAADTHEIIAREADGTQLATRTHPVLLSTMESVLQGAVSVLRRSMGPRGG